MAQISLYIQDKLMKKLKKAAKKEDLSISQWVQKRVEKDLDDDVSKLASLYGAFADTDLKRPDQPQANLDIKRKEW